MQSLLRIARLALVALSMLTAGSLPACGSMGGGGMHYFVDPPVETLVTS